MSPRHAEERWSNQLTKQYFNFAAAHFLVFADGEREPLHGHNYSASVEVEADLDDASLVADFLQVKPLFKAACDSLDHKVLLPDRSPHLQIFSGERQVHVHWREDVFSFPSADVVLLPIDNTSSELLARTLCERFLSALAVALPALHLDRITVTLSESPGQAARYERIYRRATAVGEPVRSIAAHLAR